ncbi:MAG TPA: DUF397 domain-containing protein [Streptosporangiaceae bacterium]|nr:DUF397 domain-containing protein [Streptosporangiaceae bacterium]
MGHFRRASAGCWWRWSVPKGPDLGSLPGARGWACVKGWTPGFLVEVAPVERGTAVRDAKNPGGAVLAFGGKEWKAFATAVKAGRLDLS